jgi:TolB protein
MKPLVTYLYITFLLGLSLSGCKSVSNSETSDKATMIEQLAFCGKPEGRERYDVFLLDFSTHKWVNLTEEYVSKIDDGFGNSIGCYEFMRPYGVSGLEWSPKGDLLIVNAGEPYFRIPYVLEVSSNGEIQKIVKQWPPPLDDWPYYERPLHYSWSPNGSQIAFDALNETGGYSNLFIGDVSEWETSNSDTQLIQMTEEYRDFPGIVYAPSWSPDGNKIAVSLAGPASGIIIVSVDDRKLIYVSDDTSEKLSSVEINLLLDLWLDFPSMKPSWSPDSSEIIFLAATTPTERTTLFKVDEDGLNLTVLIPDGVYNPVFSPNGQYIAYMEYAGKLNPRTVGKIVLVDTDGKNRQVIATIKTEEAKSFFTKYYIRDLSWSPDGKWLIFTSNAGGSFQLYLLSVDGNTFGQVMDFPGDAVYPQWRP